MNKYYVTFGQKYSRTAFDSVDSNTFGGVIHPYNGHKDGWVEVNGINMAHATSIVKGAIGDTWSNIYDDSSFDESMFPLGCLFCIYNGKVK